jgi:hypothetical protein
MRRVATFSAAVLALAAIGFGLAQLPGLPKPKINVPAIPGLDLLLKEEPPITTSLGDALTEIPFLDGFEPAGIPDLSVLPRGEGGAFTVFPGAFTFEAQSYCLHAGTHGPGGGEGYLYAPLKGPKAAIVRNILRRTVEHPGMEQTHVQSLIWAILARTKPSKLQPDLREAAARLMTPQEIASLEGSAWEILKENAGGGSPFGSLPGPLRQVMEAENRLRGMFYSASAPFDELERVAVLTGEYKPQKGDRNVPRGRWSYHPEGYFARFVPHGYRHTTQTVYFPEAFQIQTDEAGIPTRIADPAGRTLRIENGQAIYSDPGQELARAEFRPEKRASDKRRGEFETLLKRLKGDAAAARRLAGIADLALSFPADADLAQREAREMALCAWMAAFAQAVQPLGADLLAAIGQPTFAGVSYDPSGNVATPGETGRQRLAQSGRCQGASGEHGNAGGEEGELQRAVVAAMRANGFPTTGNEHVHIYDQRDSGGLLRFVVRMRDGKPLPTGACIEERIAAGQVPPGSLQGADELFFGSVQFAGSLQRMGVRTVRVETGQITGAGKGDGSDFSGSADRAFGNYKRYH